MPVAVVTGGAGFIGSHAVERLIEKGYEVRVIDNLVCGNVDNISSFIKSGKCKFFENDIQELEADSIIFKNADFILHFAGIGDIVPSIQKPAEYMSVNVQGTIKVLESARANRVNGSIIYPHIVSPPFHCEVYQCHQTFLRHYDCQ